MTMRKIKIIVKMSMMMKNLDHFMIMMKIMKIIAQQLFNQALKDFEWMMDKKYELNEIIK